MTSPNPGHVYLVGAGPGDPGLVTRAAVDAVRRADVVLYDALAPRSLLREAPKDVTLCFVGKRSGDHARTQSEIEALIVDHALAGRTVARVKGGDPFVFGRGGEEALACRKAGVPFTVVPGITSAIAAPAYAGIPVTHRGLSAGFFVITGNESGQTDDAVDWAAAAKAGTLVILMGVAGLGRATELLRANGLAPETPVACVRWGTRHDQALLRGTLADIAERAIETGLKSPVVTVVGPVAALAEELAWFDPGPLAGKRVVVTRARAQASHLADRLDALGAHVIETPVLRIEPGADVDRLAEAITGDWEWLAITSANGAEALFTALDAAGRDTRALAGTAIAAVGQATADRLRAGGLVPDFVPSHATSETLADELPLSDGDRLLYPTSSLADDKFARRLEERGAKVAELSAYATIAEPLDAGALAEIFEADAICFTSASTVANLAKALDGAPLPLNTKLVSMGDRTSAALDAIFGRIDAVAPTPGIDGLVEATVAALGGEA